MVTVEADPVDVESRLAGGAIGCPACSRRRAQAAGVCPGLARSQGLCDPVRPRRARCRSCLVTHVLLPVTVLLRRAHAAERVWMSLTARAQGFGHRRIAARSEGPGGHGAGLVAPSWRASGITSGVVPRGGGAHRYRCGDPGRVRLPLARPCGCGHRRGGGDRAAVRVGRVAGRGDAAAGDGGPDLALSDAPARIIRGPTERPTKARDVTSDSTSNQTDLPYRFRGAGKRPASWHTLGTTGVLKISRTFDHRPLSWVFDGGRGRYRTADRWCVKPELYH